MTDQTAVDATEAERALPATALLFREDAYARQTAARVVAVTADGGIILDRTVFYANSGGQPGDVGYLVDGTGRRLPVETAVWADGAKTLVRHVVRLGSGVESGELSVGDPVDAVLDWDIRHRRMRMHTCLHLLSVVLPYPVTGGAIGEDEGRLDFNIPDAGLERERITDELNALVSRDAAVASRWITDAELDASPGLVKTMSVQPPRGSGMIRLVEIEGLDLQPCGGTHVRRTSEIGPVTVSQIEKKGKLNRRVRVRFA